MRVMAFVAVCTGVAALAAGAFVLSYAGIHAVALQAGISHRLARGYPLIFDVLLVVILAALLALRGAGWPSRVLAWVCLLALLAAAAGADALHAAGRRLPARPAAVTAAILPWALVLIAFVLLRRDCTRARFLDRPVLVWLGDVSYSFYCSAMPVLIAVAWALLTIVPESLATTDLGATALVLASAVLCVAISLVLARVSFARVEMPCMAIGRLWSKRIEFGGNRVSTAY